MINFTKEEISLCKQVVEKYRKNIVRGDWYAAEMFCPVKDIKAHLKMMGNDYVEIGKKKYSIGLRTEISIMTPERQLNAIWFPLWTISDCLEFLEEKTTDWSLDKDIDREGRQTGKFSFWWMPSPKYKDNYRLGKTILEACLKAVLAVLEDNK